MLTTGLTVYAEVMVDDTNTSVTMGSGSLKVFATPAMIALIEKAACKALEGQLEDDRPQSAQSLTLRTLPLLPPV